MTQANDHNDYERQFRHLNRRLERLEDTLITPQEFDRAFDRLHKEFQSVHSEVAAVNGRLEQIETELTGKIDTMLRHITGQA
jgi:chaperonin cofactor prefoldin